LDKRIRIKGYEKRERIRTQGNGYKEMDIRKRIQGYGYKDTDTRIRIQGIGYKESDNRNPISDVFARSRNLKSNHQKFERQKGFLRRNVRNIGLLSVF
jgi:hypothetical protein